MKKYIIIRLWKKYYLLNKEHLNNFIAVKGKETQLWFEIIKNKIKISNFELILNEKIKNGLLLNQQKYEKVEIYTIKNVDNLIKKYWKNIYLLFINIEYTYKQELQKIVQIYLDYFLWKTNKKKLKKQERYIQWTIKEIWKHYFHFDFFNWIRQFENKNIIFVDKDFTNVKNIIEKEKNKIIEKNNWKLLCKNNYFNCNLINYFDYNSFKQILDDFDRTKNLHWEIKIFEDILQTTTIKLKRKEILIDFYLNLKNLIIEQLTVLRQNVKYKNLITTYNFKQIIDFIKTQIKKDIRKNYNSYFYNKETKELLKRIEKGEEKLKITMKIVNNKYNMIKNWFLTNYIYFVVTWNKKTWENETKEILKKIFSLFKRIQIQDKINNMYFVSDDIILKTINNIQKKYENGELTKKDYINEIKSLSNNLIDEKDIKYLFEIFQNKKEFYNLIKKYEK